MTVSSTTLAVDWFESAPLLPAGRAADLGPTLVVAPHPDDEVLGCGGVIAVLRQADIPVRVVIASDGAASHPGSKAYPPQALAALRRTEAEAGLGLLGVPGEHVTCLGLPDGAMPTGERPDYPHALTLASAALQSWTAFETVLLPWRRDPHHDHRATWALLTAVLDGLRSPVRRLEYPIWSRVHPGPDDLPQVNEASAWRLDIGGVREAKRAAILAHRSQTTGSINDAEIGECLTADVLARFFVPWEPFIEVREAGQAAAPWEV